MGNSLSPCLHAISTTSRRSSSAVNLIFSNGVTKSLTGNHHIAGEIMFQFPDMMICHADSFFIGHPIPSLAIDDQLLAGETYFVLPIDLFASFDVLSTSSLASIGAGNAKFSGQSPFEYIRGTNGRIVIKIVPEFLVRLISPAAGEGGGGNFLCSTPELQKHYDQLVGSTKGQVWSPKLESISEYKIRYSPCKFVGFKVKQKEG
ncbi:uncharacterized protein LOC111434251 [Cucurbita moschata]|uniref:Uncharacterized protein LOC111434251 n=1 Tax=Cucurbita moschata TaxID=3662 RepID=A0A6J1EHY7_CUCMO|nr:uncharacterized protein LOC111434251 [Cucurbita moschata]